MPKVVKGRIKVHIYSIIINVGCIKANEIQGGIDNEENHAKNSSAIKFIADA